MKDYYKILQIKPSASQADIKTAYRRLAHLYHPDKNDQADFSITHFTLIKEAYETLSDPAKKEQYLHTRWLYKAANHPYEKPVITVTDLLELVIQSNLHIHSLDRFRVDKEAILTELLSIICKENIFLLNQQKDYFVNEKIIHLMLENGEILSFYQQLQLLDVLKTIATLPSTAYKLQLKQKEILRKKIWSKLTPFILFSAIILLCIIIALSK